MSDKHNIIYHHYFAGKHMKNQIANVKNIEIKKKINISLILFGFYDADKETGLMSQELHKFFSDMIQTYSNDIVFNILFMGRIKNPKESYNSPKSPTSVDEQETIKVSEPSECDGLSGPGPDKPLDFEKEQSSFSKCDSSKSDKVGLGTLGQFGEIGIPKLRDGISQEEVPSDMASARADANRDKNNYSFENNDGIHVHYYHIDDDDIYDMMYKHNFEFMCFTHRLFGFNIVSYLMSLEHCNDVLHKNVDLIENNRVFFSRIDTFCKNSDKICNYMMDLTKNNIVETGLLRDEILEDRYFVMYKEDLLLFLSHINQMFQFVVKKSIECPIRNYPEAWLFDFFKQNDILKKYYLTLCTLVTEVSVNWTKYSPEYFQTSLSNYNKYLLRTQKPFILNSSREKLPCYHIYSNKGLCIDECWPITYAAHCVTFDIIEQLSNFVCNNLLFQSRKTDVQIIEYKEILVTLRKDFYGMCTIPHACENHPVYEPVLKIKHPNIPVGTCQDKKGDIYKSLVIKIETDFQCEYPLFRIVDLTGDTTIWMSTISSQKTNGNFDHFVHIDVKHIAEQLPTHMNVHVVEVHLLTHAKLLGQQLKIQILDSNETIMRDEITESDVDDVPLIVDDSMDSQNVRLAYSHELLHPTTLSGVEHNTAVILNGYDKFWNDEAQKKLLCDMIQKLQADLYVITYTNCFKDIEFILRDNVKFIKMRNIDEYRKKIRNYLSSVNHPQPDDHNLNVYLQYYNIEECFEEMCTQEKIKKEPYKYVFKIRSDVKLKNFKFDLDSFIEDDKIYMESDYVYYGTRKVMSIACNLFSAKFSFYDKTSWDNRPIQYDIMLQTLNSNPSYIFDTDKWNPSLFKNKLAAIPMPILPQKYGSLAWETLPREYFINACKYFLSCNESKQNTSIDNDIKPIIGNSTCDKSQIKMTSLTLFDREPNLFQCEYFIVDWMIRNRIVVCEPIFFSMICVLR